MSKRRNDNDAAERRIKVFEMFRLGMSQHEMAAKLGVSQPQICRDLKSVRVEFKAKYGAEFEPDAIVHEELETLDWIKQRALREYQRMLPTTREERGPDGVIVRIPVPRDSPSEVRARLKALDTAKHAAIDRVMLMQDLGMVERNLGTLDLTGSQVAAALREIEASASTVPEDEMSAAELAWMTQAPEREM